MNDEQWLALNAADDDAWYQRMERDFGMAIRPASEGRKATSAR